MRLKYVLSIVLVIFSMFVAGCDEPIEPLLPEGGAFTFTSDELVIHGMKYVPDTSNGKSILLLHQLGSNQQVWTAYAQELQQQGYEVLTLDLRGHGQSILRRGVPTTHQVFSLLDFRGMEKDMDFLMQYASHPEVYGIGASIGANVLFRYAAAHKRVKKVVLLSPGLEYKGISTEDVLKQYGERPVMIVAGKGDDYAYYSSQELTRQLPGAELVEFDDERHGTAFLGEVDAQILAFLSS